MSEVDGLSQSEMYHIISEGCSSCGVTLYPSDYSTLDWYKSGDELMVRCLWCACALDENELGDSDASVSEFWRDYENLDTAL